MERIRNKKGVEGKGGEGFPLALILQFDHWFDELKATTYRRKKERSVAFKIRQNAFPVRAPLDPAGELTTLP